MRVPSRRSINDAVGWDIKSSSNGEWMQDGTTHSNTYSLNTHIQLTLIIRLRFVYHKHLCVGELNRMPEHLLHPTAKVAELDNTNTHTHRQPPTATPTIVANNHSYSALAHCGSVPCSHSALRSWTANSERTRSVHVAGCGCIVFYFRSRACLGVISKRLCNNSSPGQSVGNTRPEEPIQTTRTRRVVLCVSVCVCTCACVRVRWRRRRRAVAKRRRSAPSSRPTRGSSTMRSLARRTLSWLTRSGRTLSGSFGTHMVFFRYGYYHSNRLVEEASK